ncbi:hypothetical protein HOY82DRAFT_600322 [Tuber indicum]|nr:hypothetical protein HOY82DRAFT_600322 [Tuber indicum]
MHYLLPLLLLLLLTAPRQVDTTFPATNVSEGLIHILQALGNLNRATQTIPNGSSPQAACSNLPEIFALADITKHYKSEVLPIITASKTLTPENGGLVLRNLKIAKQEYKKLAIMLCQRVWLISPQVKKDIAEACGIGYGNVQSNIRADKELFEKMLSGLVRIAVIYDKDEVEEAFDSVVRLYDLAIRCYRSRG